MALTLAVALCGPVLSVSGTASGVVPPGCVPVLTRIYDDPSQWEGGDPSLGGADIGALDLGPALPTHAPDMDGDGTPDTITQVPGLTTITRADGSLRIHTNEQPPYSFVRTPEGIDLNGDHRDEVLFNQSASSHGLGANYFNLIPGTTPPGDIDPAKFPTFEGTIVPDFNGDGLPDIYLRPQLPGGEQGLISGISALTGVYDILGARADLTGNGQLDAIMVGSPYSTAAAPRVIFANGTTLPLPITNPTAAKVVRNIDGRVYIDMTGIQSKAVFRVDSNCPSPATTTTAPATPPAVAAAATPAAPVVAEPHLTG